MKKKSNIVVLLSTYNGEEFIERQLQSIFKQDIQEGFDLIIRDDGSKDNTVSILEEVARKNSNVLLIKGNNRGVVGSFLDLLEKAFEMEYDYYCFSDQDDFWMPDKISSAILALESFDNNLPLFYGNRSKIVDEELNDLGYMTQEKKRELSLYNTAIQNICPGHGQVINRHLAESVLKETKIDEKLYSQDLWIINVAALFGNVIFDDTPHTLYVMHQKNELGFGKSRLDWVVQHIKRMRNNEVKKMAEQLVYFNECYDKYLDLDYKNEIFSFVDSQRWFGSRVRYILKSKLYRQKSFETIFFKIMYIFGKYNIY